MIDRYTRLRWRRKFRSRRKQAVELSDQASQNIDRYLLRRWQSLSGARRFVVTWLCLSALLIGTLIVQTRALSTYYLQAGPTGGGIYTEGMTGTFTTANPMYSTNQADSSVARLVFSGLLTYNQRNQLVGDLAESWKANDKGTVYTFRLRPNLQWHDGRPVTADDVVFTFRTIQNPDSKSPLNLSWQGIVVKALDDQTVEFTLPVALAAFPHSLTTGIVPKHSLEDIPVSQLRSNRFNTDSPIGTGPFEWVSLVAKGATKDRLEQRIQLRANNRYHFGRPAMDGFTLHVFSAQDMLVSAFNHRSVTAILLEGRQPTDVNPELSVSEYDLPLTSAVMLFMNTSNPLLSNRAIRLALTHATNSSQLVTALGYPVIPVNSPLLREHAGYNPALAQFTYNPAEANRLLDEAGWKLDPASGYRTKDGQTLNIELISQSNGEYGSIANGLQRQWKAVGVKLSVSLQPNDQFEQSYILTHGYSLLLYGISIGADPDVYAYWHSSQASSGGLNLSEYRSKVADQALEAGRSRGDIGLRSIKYKPFLESWRNDAVAIGFYQPRLLYLVRGKLYNFNQRHINVTADRLNNVFEWMINEQKTLKE